jgi:hypothetical protein
MERRTKFVLIGLGVVAIGTGGYFLYKNLTKDKDSATGDEFKDSLIEEAKTDYTPPAKPAKTTKGYKPKPANATLPFKKYAKGTLVKDVQTALIKQYGGGILPKYGADGFYGTEMENALLSKGLPTTIDQSTYGKLIKGNASSDKKDDPKDTKKPSTPSISNDSIADLLYSGVMQSNILTVLRGLWKIKNITHYIKVNEKFKDMRINGVRNTIPTALSNAFPFDPNRKKYRAQLYRIGLKWKENQWALAGFEGQLNNRLITVQRTKVWDAKGNNIVVPSSTVVGAFIKAQNGLTEFETLEGRRLYINTNAIRYHHD